MEGEEGGVKTISRRTLSVRGPERWVRVWRIGNWLPGERETRKRARRREELTRTIARGPELVGPCGSACEVLAGMGGNEKAGLGFRRVGKSETSPRGRAGPRAPLPLDAERPGGLGRTRKSASSKPPWPGPYVPARKPNGAREPVGTGEGAVTDPSLARS
jgi:hypothetical protein